jgi:hypothetical protein
MTDDEALEALFLALRVINRLQRRMDVPPAELHGLRQMAKTDEERTMPADEFGRKIVDRLITRQTHGRKTAGK